MKNGYILPRLFAPRLQGLLGAGWLLLLMLFYLWQPLPLQTLRHLWFDQLQRWQPRQRVTATSPAVLVDIDDASLRQHGQWPWPRSLLAELTRQLQQAGARVIAFDILFAEPERHHSSNHNGTPNPANTGEQQLASALQQGQTVLGIAGSNKPEAAAPSSALLGLPAQFIWRNQGAMPATAPALPAIASSILPLPELARASSGLGHMSFLPDNDGVVRRVPLLLQQGRQLIPALALETLRLHETRHNETSRTILLMQEAGELQQLRVGKLTLPVTASGELWLHYAPSAQIASLSAGQVLQGDFDPKQVQGKLVVIGTSAQGLKDLRFSPLGAVIPGAEVHVQALEQMLQGHTLQRPGWAEGLESVLILLVGGLLIALLPRLRALHGFMTTLLALALCLTGSVWAFGQHYLFDGLTPAVLLLGLAGFCGMQQHVRNERQARWIRNAFSRYVSPNRVDFLIQHPEALELGGQRQECSFVFTDLADFTTLMETRDPAEAVGLLNTYLDAMISIAFRYEGTLDRITGDAIAIMFSAPIRQEDHAWRALACAADMQRFAQEYARWLQSQAIPFGQTRIGVHTGEVLVGNFGGGSIVDYRALGDTVNTAARLESANKTFGTLLCLSHTTLAAAELTCQQRSAAGVPQTLPILPRPLGKLLLKGRHQPLMTYEGQLPQDGSAGEAQRQQLADYTAAYQLLSSDSSEDAALTAFAALAARCPEDGVIRFQRERLEAGGGGEVIRVG